MMNYIITLRAEHNQLAKVLQIFCVVYCVYLHQLNHLLKATSKPKAKPNEGVDTKEQHFQKIENVLVSEIFNEPSKGVVRFLALLEALYQHNPQSFAKATEVVTGNSRTYFAKDEASLLKHGNSVKAKQIPSSPFWVVTNNNTNRKGLIVTNVMREMGLPKKLIKRVQGLFV